MNEQARDDAVANAVVLLGARSAAAERVLGPLWDAAFQEGCLAALDEMQDRFLRLHEVAGR